MDFFQRDGCSVGDTAAAVDVGVGAGADVGDDGVFGCDFGSGMDAPTLCWRIHFQFSQILKKSNYKNMKIKEEIFEFWRICVNGV